VDAVTITPDRRKLFDFSSVYLDATQRVLVPSSSKARSLAEMPGKWVCATIGSTSLAYVTKHFPDVHPYRVPLRTDCLVALQRGRVDGITSDDAILRGLEAQDPYTKVIGPALEPEPYGMAINHAHPDFVRFV